MSDKNLIMTLAKVIIAAAWADGEMSHAEVNSLKYLLFRLSDTGSRQGVQITGREWAMLEMYIESPVDAAERANLVKELQIALRTPKDRTLALSALEDVIHADDMVTAEEQAVAEEIKTALETVDLGLIGQLGRLIRGAMTDTASRETRLEDFIKNKIYYTVCQRLESGEVDVALNLLEEDLRKLCLAEGLIARVAQVDQKVTADEFDAMVKAVQADWNLNQAAAAFVVEVAVAETSPESDPFRLMSEFLLNTTEDERIRLLDVMFAVAVADGQASNEELEEIRRLAHGLKLAHGQFIDAKLKIPRERRAT